MRVLILSLDRALVNKSGEGDTFKRFIAYKKACAHLAVIVPANRKAISYERDGIKVYPAFGQNNLVAYWRLYGLVKKITERGKVGLVVANDAVLGAIAILARGGKRYKVQINVFGLEIIDKHWLKERPQNIVLKWIQEWAIKRADGLRADNRKEKKLLMKHYGIASRKIAVIPIAPSKKSQQRFLQAKPSQKLRKKLIGNHKYLVLSAGSLVKAKDFPMLVKAAKLVVRGQPETVFVIAGEGSERKKLEKGIKKRNLQENVKLLGSVNYQELPTLFASADLFVLSSSHEGFPRVLMEAALTSRPIVSTNIDGAQEVVQDRVSGLLVPVRSPVKLADAISELLSDRQTADRYGAEARKSVLALLDFEKTVKQVTDSWKKIVHET